MDKLNATGIGAQGAADPTVVVAFEDLGMEAIYEFEVVDMPVTVAVDSQGESVHQTGPAEWRVKIADLNLGSA